jgi:hypothetical protein
MTKAKKPPSSGILCDIVKDIDFFKFSNKVLPSRTPLTMEEKSSLRRIISAAF